MKETVLTRVGHDRKIKWARNTDMVKPDTRSNGFELWPNATVPGGTSLPVQNAPIPQSNAQPSQPPMLQFNACGTIANITPAEAEAKRGRGYGA